MNDATYQRLVDACATARDFCGSELEAFRECCADNGLTPSEALRWQVLQDVNRLYAEARRGIDHPTSA